MLRAYENGMGLILSKTAGVLNTIGNWVFPGLCAFSAGMDLAQGRSIGAIAGDQAGCYVGDKLVTKALSKFNFPGKGLVSVVGSIAASTPLASLASGWMDKHMPIGTLHLHRPQTQPQIPQTNYSQAVWSLK